MRHSFRPGCYRQSTPLFSLNKTVPYLVWQQGDWRTRAAEGAAPQHAEQALGEAANGRGLFSG